MLLSLGVDGESVSWMPSSNGDKLRSGIFSGTIRAEGNRTNDETVLSKVPLRPSFVREVCLSTCALAMIMSMSVLD